MQNLHLECKYLSWSQIVVPRALWSTGTCPCVQRHSPNMCSSAPKDIGAPRRRCGMGSSQRPGQGIVDDVKRTLGTHWRAGMS